MKTLRLRAEAASPDCADLHTAAGILRAGGTVAFATETVYGLGANALDPLAVARVFAAKQRPSWDPLIVHIGNIAMLAQVVCSVPPPAQAWIRSFWPGPLTLIMPRAAVMPDAVTAGRATIAVRMPSHPVALALLQATGLPIAAPSANTFGHVSPTGADHVAADLDGRIDAILDSGPTWHGVESTVVDTSVEPCLLYRPGAVGLEELREVWSDIQTYQDGVRTLQGAAPESLPSPGLGLRHYAPRARLMLVEQPFECSSLGGLLIDVLAQARSSGLKAGVMLPAGVLSEPRAAVEAAAVYNWGEWEDLATLAHRLFAGLRELDSAGVQVIVCPLPRTEGLGIAIIDRLRKAARRS